MPAQAEQPFDARTIQPARRAGVPGPSAPADMRRDGIDVGRDHVRLDPITIRAAARAAAIDRIEQREQIRGAIAVAHLREREHRPRGRMRVLAAVLPDARRIALDITGIDRRTIERRCEQQGQAIVAADQLRFQRVHCLSGAHRVRRARQHAPRLRDRVDRAFGVAGRAERRTVVEVAAPIPCAVPSRIGKRIAQRGGTRRPARRQVGRAARRGERGERRERRMQKPPEPDTFTPPGFADPVHAVVPVARADQRQAMLADLRETGLQSAHAMLEQRRARFRDARDEERVLLVGGQRSSVDERDRYIENRAVAADVDVVRNRMREPDAVVGDPCAYAAAAFRQPPVLHVAFRKLARRRPQQMLARQGRAGDGERHAVLQLVAKAVRAARLIEARTRPDPARQRLVQQPAVQHQIHRAVRCLDLDRAERLVPERRHGGEYRVEIRLTVMRDQLSRRCRVGALAEQQDDFDAAAGFEIDRGLQRGTRVEPGADAARQRRRAGPARKTGGIAQDAIAADELAPVRAPRGLQAA